MPTPDTVVKMVGGPHLLAVAVVVHYELNTKKAKGRLTARRLIHYVSTVSIQNRQQDSKNCTMPLGGSTYLAII
jgi:hypothetical protein